MCTGLEIAGIATALAGTGMGLGANAATNQAMNSAAGAELNRQTGYEKQGQQVFEKSLAQSTPAASNQQQQQGTQNALKEYAALNAIPSAPPPVTGGSATENKVNEAGSKATVGASGASMAPMQGYNDWQVMQQIKDLQANTALNQNATFARQSAAVLPLEMQQAQGKYSALSGIGSLAQTAGGLMGLYGALNPATAASGASSAGAGSAFDWSNPGTWGNQFLQPLNSGAIRVLPMY